MRDQESCDAELERYQSELMDVLARKDIDLATRLTILREGEAFAPYAAYVETFDPDLVALGTAILERWARRERNGE
jgi:hypothetical protein